SLHDALPIYARGRSVDEAFPTADEGRRCADEMLRCQGHSSRDVGKLELRGSGADPRVFVSTGSISCQPPPPPMRTTCDYLVIGSGIAGLSFALEAGRHGEVIIVTKRQSFESNTHYAQGGIDSVLDREDS